MRKLLLIAEREFITNLRRPAFLGAALGVPLFTIVLMLVIFTLISQNETDLERVGTVAYVDESGILEAARERPAIFIPFATAEDARTALDSREIGAYFVLPPDYLTTGTLRLYTASDAPLALSGQIEDFLLANLGARLNDPQVVDRIQMPVDLTIRTLDNGRELASTALGGLFLSPLIFVLVMQFSAQIASSYLMSGVVEEKSNRMIEVLITSVTPLQLLVGKILGLGTLGLAQLGLWLAAGGITLALGQNTTFLSGVTLPPDMVVIGLVYFLLSYLLIGSLMAGIGAVMGSEQESRQYAGLFTLAMMLPFFFLVPILNDPDGLLARFFTLFPLTAPITAVLRVGFGSLPGWQLAASIIIMAATTALVIWAAARLFRWSLLMYGKRPHLGAVLRGLRQPRTAATREGAR